MSGTVPRAPVRPLVCEAFARRLHRPVTLAEAGFPSAPDNDDQRIDLAEQLVDIGRSDMDPSRRQVLRTGAYTTALGTPLFGELTERSVAVHSGHGVRIGAGEVARVRTMTERVADILDELGGRQARPMAAAYLVNTVAPYLRASARDEVRKDMLSAASDLVYLLGWMAMYEKDHGIGQRYYFKALELATAADDPTAYGRTLRGMSLQAAHLGHGVRASELAEAAAAAVPAGGPRLTAFLRGQQAYAVAMTGDRRQAFAWLREAESALDRADARREAIGGYDRCAYEFHVASVLYHCRDLPGSVKALKASLREQPAQERQGRVHAYAVLAGRQFEMGHLDAACESWDRFLDAYPAVSTARGDDHLDTMVRRLRPHRRSAPARRLLERAHQARTPQV
ncbi:hypothetical protein [Streptomyces marincola]|uniref:hypothetical protein n=1 Tax=Streptomyces marincola TaxID=2878388 RepID=UPI001CF1C853|nr:hypothetical protein [Streptomyces marincola]UCM91724.1 hypothetical protein LC193_05690 [Streptomyces marincola]